MFAPTSEKLDRHRGVVQRPLRVVPILRAFLVSWLFCRIDFQEEPDYSFHPWALANGIECGGGGNAMAAAGRAGGQEGVEDEEWSFDYDGDAEDMEVRNLAPPKNPRSAIYQAFFFKGNITHCCPRERLRKGSGPGGHVFWPDLRRMAPGTKFCSVFG